MVNDPKSTAGQAVSVAVLQIRSVSVPFGRNSFGVPIANGELLSCIGGLRERGFGAQTMRHPAGLKASGSLVGHHQVWARDSMISLLGARFVDDLRIRDALHASIALLRQKQAPGGAIPNNVIAPVSSRTFAPMPMPACGGLLAVRCWRLTRKLPPPSSPGTPARMSTKAPSSACRKR